MSSDTRELPGWEQTILIVEDDRALRRLFADALVLAGFRVQQVADGIAALEIIAAEPPNLVVLDLGLPLLDGLAVHQEIAAHAETRHIPFLVVTGSAEDFSRQLPNVRVLRKPITPEHLVAAVRRCLSGGRVPDASRRN